MTEGKINEVTSDTRKSDHENQELDTRCRFGACKCSCLQVFNSAKWFAVWCCCLTFLQGLSQNGVNNVNASSYEKRFMLGSTQVGWVYSTYDIVGGILLIPISYFGAYMHQPRLLGMMVFLMAIGSFLMALPHFTTGLYEYSSTQTGQCIIGQGNNTECTPQLAGRGADLGKYQYVLMLGQALLGISGSTLYVTAFIYIDSNVKPQTSPIFQAIILVFGILGPVFGFIMGGQFLNFFTDFDQVEQSSVPLSPKDPAWVGAWWVGWILAGLLLVPIIFTFLPYPKHLPGYQTLEKDDQAHNDEGSKVASRDGFGKSYKDLPKSLLILVKNPTYLFSTLAGVSDVMITSGVANFLSKLVYYQFGTTPALAGILSGAAIAPGAAVGILVGAVLVKLGKLKVKGMLILCIFANVVAALAACGFFVHCSGVSIAGVNTQYGQGDSSLDKVELQSACNQDCSCSTRIYQPICSNDEKQYFNPCYGGCQSFSRMEKKYANCSCIPGPGSAMLGSCDRSCTWQLGTFLFLIFCMATAGFAMMVPSQMISLRCVSYQQRSFSLGLKSVVARLLGAVPGPVIYGTLFDSSCTVWQEACGRRGTCWVYDHWAVAWKFAVVSSGLRVVGMICVAVALATYKPPEEDKDVEFNSMQEDSTKAPTGGQSAEERSTKKEYVTNGVNNPAYQDVT